MHVKFLLLKYDRIHRVHFSATCTIYNNLTVNHFKMLQFYISADLTPDITSGYLFITFCLNIFAERNLCNREHAAEYLQDKTNSLTGVGGVESDDSCTQQRFLPFNSFHCPLCFVHSCHSVLQIRSLQSFNLQMFGTGNK